MRERSAVVIPAGLLAIRAFAQTSVPSSADSSSMKAGGAATFATFGAFEASVILQARRDALARTNDEIANRRVAALQDPGTLNRDFVEPRHRQNRRPNHLDRSLRAGGSNILRATEAFSNGKPVFSRPAVELSQDAVGAYEK